MNMWGAIPPLDSCNGSNSAHTPWAAKLYITWCDPTPQVDQSRSDAWFKGNPSIGLTSYLWPAVPLSASLQDLDYWEYWDEGPEVGFSAEKPWGRVRVQKNMWKLRLSGASICGWSESLGRKKAKLQLKQRCWERDGVRETECERERASEHRRAGILSPGTVPVQPGSHGRCHGCLLLSPRRF